MTKLGSISTISMIAVGAIAAAAIAGCSSSNSASTVSAGTVSQATVPVPSGWKIIKSSKIPGMSSDPRDRDSGLCQIAVPPDWVADAQMNAQSGEIGHMKSPDDAVKASVSQDPFSWSLADAKRFHMQFNREEQAVEDSSARFWSSHTAMGDTYWTVIIPSKPACEAHFILHSPAAKDTAKKIVATLGPAQ